MFSEHLSTTLVGQACKFQEHCSHRFKIFSASNDPMNNNQCELLRAKPIVIAFDPSAETIISGYITSALGVNIETQHTNNETQQTNIENDKQTNQMLTQTNHLSDVTL